MSEIISFEDYLNEYDTLTYTNVGVSMMPLLRQGKDMFTVRRKGPERCEKGDVVLYKRPPDQYVLHRVVEVRPTSYVILGDNCVYKEYGITDEDIIGVLVGYVRGGQAHSVREPGYRIYTSLIMATMPLRTTGKKFFARAKNIFKRIIK